MDRDGGRHLKLKPGGEKDPDISNAGRAIWDEEVYTVTRSSVGAQGTNQFIPEGVRRRSRCSEPRPHVGVNDGVLLQHGCGDGLGCKEATENVGYESRRRTIGQ